MISLLRISVLVAALFFANQAAAQPFCLCLKCLLLGHQSVYLPSGSMKPTFEPDQCFTISLRPSVDDIQRGTVISFRHPATDIQFVQRVVALGGDTVQMIDGRVVLNGVAFDYMIASPYQQVMQQEGSARSMPLCPLADKGATGRGEVCEITRLSETVDGVSYEVLDLGTTSVDNTPVFNVPEGHVFVLGDNRDNSLDSRMPLNIGGIGFVPLENVIGVFDAF